MKHKESTKRLMSQKASLRIGDLSSSFGSFWVTDGINNKKISRNGNIPKGFRKGRICPWADGKNLIGKNGKRKKDYDKWHVVNCKICNKEFEKYKSDSRKCCSAECSKKTAGGIREGSGRSISGFYNDVFCQSSYEFAFVYLMISEGKEVIRNKKGFSYLDKNSVVRKYYPDFTVDNVYYEIKGYLREEDKYKTVDFQYPFVMIHGKEMLDLLKEVEILTGLKKERFYLLYSEKTKSVYDSKEYKCKSCSIMFKGKHKQKNYYCSRSCAGKSRHSTKKKQASFV